MASFSRWVAASAAVVFVQTVAFDAMQRAPRVPQARVSLQPLAHQAAGVDSTLSYPGQPLAAEDGRLIDDAIGATAEEEGVRQIQTALDKYVLAVVRINAESRVSVEQGSVAPQVVQ